VSPRSPKGVIACTLSEPRCSPVRSPPFSLLPQRRRGALCSTGKDLGAWTPKIKGYPAGENFADTFRVKDGLLRVRYDGAFKNRFGHLFYKTPFTNYLLRVEYRFVGE
jgi:hypothetical protein